MRQNINDIAIFRLLQKNLKTFALLALLSLVNCATISQRDLVIGGLGSEYPQINFGVSLIRVSDGKVIYSRNQEMLFVPASTNKLLTAAASLLQLGPEFRYETKFFTNKRNGSAIGDLYLVGSGDPTYSSADIWRMVHELRQMGIRKIEGDIIIDSSIFDDERYGKGWMLSDLAEGFSAPITGLCVDGNRVVVKASVDDLGTKSIVTFPDTKFFKVEHRNKSALDASEKVLSVSGEKGISENGIIFVGDKFQNNKTVRKSFAVSEPEALAAFIVQEELSKNEIAFSGAFQRKKLADFAQVLSVHVSKSLSEILVDTMKFSDNHATESIVKSLGVGDSNVGSFEGGLASLKKNLAGLEKTMLVDGSGLSRYNQLSPKNLTDVLVHMGRDFKNGPVFIATVPIRQVGQSFVRVKTGSMSGVSNVAGYVKLNGDLMALAIMTSGPGLNSQPQKELIEKILALITGSSEF